MCTNLLCIQNPCVSIHVPSIGVTSPCDRDWVLVPDLLPLSPSPLLKEWEGYVGEDNLGLLGAPRGVRGLDGSLFLSERDELPGFFEGRGCGGLRGWRGFNGWRGFSSLSELLEPLLPVKNKQKHTAWFYWGFFVHK